MTYIGGIPTTPLPRTPWEQGNAYGRLLALVAAAVDAHSPRYSNTERVELVRDLLHDAGIHGGQVDDDGMPVPPPHDQNCRVCGWRNPPTPIDVRAEVAR